VGEVLSALAEGLAIAAAVRVFGHGEATITRWRDRAGLQAVCLHEHLLQHLHLPHVQVDEIRTRLRQRTQILWLWLAVDPVTKLVPIVHLGPRTQASAHTVIHALRAVLAPGCVPLVTSDGLGLYYYAMTAHFGSWVTQGRRRVWQLAPALLYGQVQKRYRARRLVRVTQRVLCGTRERMRTTLQQLGFSGTLNTAFVERLNLTVRQGVPALARRTWATAQTPQPLHLHLEWWRAYYHLVRPHRALRVAYAAPAAAGHHQRRRYRARTPAMAAGLTTRRWRVAELLAVPGGLVSG
jgi:IS1 family transposase